MRAETPRAIESRVARSLPRLAVSVALVLTLCAAVVRLTFGFAHLVRPTSDEGGWDVALRWAQVQAWFAGQPVYGVIESADYAPASHVLLWPFLGWTDTLHSRWLWATTMVCALLWLGWMVARESPARSRAGVLWFALLPASLAATFACMETGQVTIHGLAVLIAGVLVIVRGRSWRSDLVGSAAVVAALIKPGAALPIVWVAFLVPRRIRPAVLITVGYAALTLSAAWYQPAPLFDLARSWLVQELNADVTQSTANLHRVMTQAGLSAWFPAAALGLVLAAGYWVYRHRSVDVFVLLGVTALVARLWSRHYQFDDLLIVLPLLALFRLAARRDGGDRHALIAGVLGATLAALLLAPQGWLASHAFGAQFQLAQGTTWLFALAFLMMTAARARRRSTLAGSLPVADPTFVAGRAPLLSGALTERLRVWMAAKTLWPLACFVLPVAVLIAMYAWLAVEHRTLWLWSVPVHESGRHTFGQTVFYFDHFLRELPTLLAMTLFGLAAYGVPAASRADTAARRRYAMVLCAAALLAAAAFSAAAIEHGTGVALRNLLQYYTRDDAIQYGSHWRYHWLSTVWYGAAILLVARLAALWLGAPVPAPPGDRRSFMAAAWLYFLLLTVVFGFAAAIFDDPLHIGHQAREMATHTMVTMPVTLGIIAWLDRRHGPTSSTGSAAIEADGDADAMLAIRLPWYLFAVVLAVPMYFVLPIQYAGVVASGQDEAGLAPMVAAHFFEHALDYLFVALLTFGAYGLLRTAHRSQ